MNIIKTFKLTRFDEKRVIFAVISNSQGEFMKVVIHFFNDRMCRFTAQDITEILLIEEARNLWKLYMDYEFTYVPKN